MQDLALSIVELHRVPLSPFVQLVEVPLDGSATLWFVSHSSKFFVTSRLAEGTHSVPSSRPLLKTLNRVSYCIPVIFYSSPCIDLWGTSLVLGLQPRLVPLNAILWGHHSDNFQPTLLFAHPVCT